MAKTGDARRAAKDYLGAISAYDEALAIVLDRVPVNTANEGQFRLQIAVSIANGMHYAGSWAAGDEGPEKQLAEMEGRLMDRFQALLPRGLAEARSAVNLLPGSQKAIDVLQHFEYLRERWPAGFRDA